jgi:hypothetical protein
MMFVIRRYVFILQLATSSTKKPSRWDALHEAATRKVLVLGSYVVRVRCVLKKWVETGIKQPRSIKATSRPVPLGHPLFGEQS